MSNSSETVLKKSFAILGYRDFRCYLTSRFFNNIAIQIQVLVISWWVWRLTHDPLSLGLVGLFEVVPFIALAMWGGHLADRHDKKSMILLGETFHFLCTLALIMLIVLHVEQVWWIYAVIALTGVVRSFLWSATQAYPQQAVPREIYSRAAAWNSSVWEIGAIGGPAIGGLLYAWIGPAGALGVAVSLMGIALVYAIRMGRRPPTPSQGAEESLIASMMSGIRFVFANQIILSALALDMFAVLFGGVMAILPIFADRLGMGPVGLGWLRAAPALGAILMALYMTSRPPIERVGRTLLTVVTIFGLCILAFAFSQSFWLSMALLMVSGAADNISVIIRHSIIQAYTPDEMRGRVSAVNGIFIGSSNELGAFESGVMAKFMGTVPSVIFGGLMTLLTVALIAWKAPSLRSLRNIHNDTTA